MAIPELKSKDRLKIKDMCFSGSANKVKHNRVMLFERIIQLKLSPEGAQRLASFAEILSEGDLYGDRYLGSTMLTIDLTKAREQFVEPIDKEAVALLASMLPGDQEFNKVIRGLVAADAQRLSFIKIKNLSLEISSRLEGFMLYLDGDVEAYRAC